MWLLFLLSSSLFPLCSTILEIETLKEMCPRDTDLCHRRAAKGDCFGSYLRSHVLQKQCECACSAVHHDRIQTCCKAVGEKEMKFCLPLCGYNTSLEELGSTLGIKCVSQLTTWAYCAADNFDNTNCCASRGVPVECQSFCQGKVPTCDIQSIFSYQGCMKHMRSILACQKDGLGASARYDPEWSSTCDWEG